MKILVIGLLRIGDTVMMTPVLKGLSEKFPQAEIHFLMNADFKGLAPLIEDVDVFHYFDRKGLQGSLGDPTAPLFQAIDQLGEWMRRTNACKFDQIYNLTQTRVAGFIAGQIEASHKFGLHLDGNGQAEYGSTWFGYLNAHVAGGGQDVFHYSDVFQYGCGLQPGIHSYSLQESERGKEEASCLLPNGESPIVVQMNTSDPKKDWSEESWLETLFELQVLNPTEKFYLLGAPQDSGSLAAFTEKAKLRGIFLHPAPCSLEGAYSLIKRSKLLLTLDTAMKHFATAAGTPVVELCLGSADERKTGAYAPDSVLIKPQISCFPCAHSSACYKPRHECADGISPSVVALAVTHRLCNQWSALKTVAREYINEVVVLRTRFLSSGIWISVPLYSKNQRWAFERVLNRSTWKLYLQEAHKKLVGEYGSEGLSLKDAVRWLFSDLPQQERLRELNFIESELLETEDRLRTISMSLRAFARNNSEGFRLQHLSEKIQDWVENIEEKEGTVTQVLGLAHRLRPGEIPDLQTLRSIENHMRSFMDRQDIKLKLIRSLKNQAMENL